MIDKYDKCEDIESEINHYIALLNRDELFKDESELRNVSKYILVLKYVQQLYEEKHYGKCMMYDLLLTVDAITGKQKKVFYIYYRSFIENFIRFVLSFEDSDKTGVLKMFERFKETCSSEKTSKIYNYINGEYGKCCGYVHSNVKANMSIYEYYQDIINTEEMNEKERESMILVLQTSLKACVEFLVIERNPWIDSAFYKRKQKLKYLVSPPLYYKFTEIVECQ